MVDKALLHVTHDQRAPLILATFDHHHGMFHEVSKNPALLDERIEGDPEKMSLDDMRHRARRDPQAAARAGAQGHRGAPGAPRPRTIAGPTTCPNISKAAVYGRVQTLLIEDGRRIAGNLDRKTGEITGMSSSPQADGQDLLDDVSELVLAAGGHVYVLPKSDDADRRRRGRDLPVLAPRGARALAA